MSAALLRALASGVVRIAAALLPAAMRHWGEAMRHEVDAIEAPGAALGFALGCLGSAIAFSFQHPARLPLAVGPSQSGTDMLHAIVERPRRLVALCAILSTALGLGYLALSEAPARYLGVNLAALLIGLAIAATLGDRSQRLLQGMGGPVLGLALLAVSLFGIGIDGATRWIMLGGLSIQPSMILLPVLVLGFAGGAGRLATLGLAIAALALALQPDRAMAGALVAGLAALALLRPERNVLLALVAAGSGFVATLIQPDVQPAMPHVDQIFYTAFAVHPLAGLAVVGGALVMLVPAIFGWARDADHRAAYAVFGAVWLAILVAAALGNYPTPLVGYGGSAIIGYVVSLLGLPRRAADRGAARDAQPAPADTGGRYELRVAL